MYSPLEQFAPLPFVTFFYFPSINIAFTNVTIVFIFILLVFFFLFNGYIKNIFPKSRTIMYNKDFGLIGTSSLRFPVTRHERSPHHINLPHYQNFNPLWFFEVNLRDAMEHFAILYKRLFFTPKNLISFTISILNIFIYLLSLSAIKKKIKVAKAIYNTDIFYFQFNTMYLAHRIFLNGLKNLELKHFGLKKKFNQYGLVVLNELFIFENSSLVKIFRRDILRNLFCNIVNLRSKISTIEPLLEMHAFFTRFDFYSKSFISNFNIYILENTFNVILNMVKENIGGHIQRALHFFPFIFSLFSFILLGNLIGLIPYSSTITSYLIITFSLAVMVLVGVNIIAGELHGFLYFGHFLPSGCPFLLYPLIIPIEFISYVFRVVSLSVRLFANMMAGHTLLAVLAGFSWVMATGGSTILLLAHPLPILVVFVLIFLETAVAIIQAYVFTILTCMYLDEAINLH